MSFLIILNLNYIDSISSFRKKNGLQRAFGGWIWAEKEVFCVWAIFFPTYVRTGTFGFQTIYHGFFLFSPLLSVHSLFDALFSYLIFSLVLSVVVLMQIPGTWLFHLMRNCFFAGYFPVVIRFTFVI